MDPAFVGDDIQPFTSFSCFESYRSPVRSENTAAQKGDAAPNRWRANDMPGGLHDFAQLWQNSPLLDCHAWLFRLSEAGCSGFLMSCRQVCRTFRVAVAFRTMLAAKQEMEAASSRTKHRLECQDWEPVRSAGCQILVQRSTDSFAQDSRGLHLAAH